MKKLLCLFLCLFLLSGCGSLVEQQNVPEEHPQVPVEQELLSRMTLEEKIAQMFLVRCPAEDALELAETYQPGGYLFFARDFENSSVESFQNKLEQYQSVSKTPMFFAVDEEGGTVVRASRYSQFRQKPFLSPQELYMDGGMEAIMQDAREKSAFLRYLGINLNLAPVCDVSENPADFIYDRSFGKNAKETADYVSSVVTEMVQGGLGSCLKHFPGYGNNADTHTGIAYDKRTYETFTESDFLPFAAGITAGAGMVMVSHNVVFSMDSALPASLSGEVHRILREELNFEGVIITDDLAMDAIGDFTGDENAAVLAVLTGNDMICTTNFVIQMEAVAEAVCQGEISEEAIDASVLRILRYKKKLGLG